MQEEDKKIHSGQLCRELRKIDSMPIETEKIKKENLENYGLSELMQDAEALGMKYSEFISKLNKKNLELDRKVLANLAFDDPAAFKAIVEKIKN